MANRRVLHRTSTRTPEAAAASGQRSITVQSISRFGGVHQVTWRDGRRKRRILVVIDYWPTADQTVSNAVADTYAPDDRPAVVVPAHAWR
jgi:hypothetical protein